MPRRSMWIFRCSHHRAERKLAEPLLMPKRLPCFEKLVTQTAPAILALQDGLCQIEPFTLGQRSLGERTPDRGRFIDQRHRTRSTHDAPAILRDDKHGGRGARKL